ncbi:MAG: GAF domain-containing protein [Anaerolineae bacterium]
MFSEHIAIFDAAFNLVWHNAGFDHFIAQFSRDKPVEMLTGHGWLMAWPDARHILEPHMQRLQAGGPAHAQTINVRRGAAETYWDLLVRPYPQPTDPPQFILILHDVTTHILAYQSLERQMADRVRKLEASYEVMQVAGEAIDLPTMIGRALSRVLAAVSASVGTVHLLDESGQHLQLVGQQGLAAAMADQLADTPSDMGLAGEVLRQKAPVVVPNIQTNEHTRPIFRQSKLKRYVGVAMRVKGRVIGVLSALWESKRPFHPEDVDLLDSAADQMAVAIESHRLRQKAEQLAVMEERTRLARDLHDSVSQALYSISLLATAGRRLSQSGGNQALLDETLGELGATAQQALKEMRLLLYRLRPLALQFDGLTGAIQHRLDAVEKRAGIDARLIADDLPPLPPATEEALYYITQEALNNALKHAAATAVTVQLSPETNNGLKLMIIDNGQGFELDTVREKGGMGLANMRQRAEQAGGQLAIETKPGKGTAVIFHLPPGGEQ